MRDPSHPTNESHTRSGPGFNRRDFLKGSGAAVAASALATAVEETVAQDNAKAQTLVAARPVALDLSINGKTHKVTVEPRVTLLDALRNDLNLTGAKEVCTTTNCGACTVHLNGEAVKSCTLLAVQADGAEVKTIEGMGQEGALHPLQEAFWEHHGLQCGYCTPGMIMASADLLQRNPSPSEGEVREALAGNLCRCTGYHNIVKAVLAASEA